MLNRLNNRRRRHTRPAEFVSRSCREQQLYANRPGGSAFSFSGEFPVMNDLQPVMAHRSSRCYTGGRTEGVNRPVTGNELRSNPTVCRCGVRTGTAVMLLAALAVCLALVVGSSLSECRRLSNGISTARTSINALTSDCALMKSDIAAQSGDLNIRKEARLMGMVASTGVPVNYLQAPEDADFSFEGDTIILSLANIWGQ